MFYKTRWKFFSQLKACVCCARPLDRRLSNQHHYAYCRLSLLLRA